MTDPQELYIFAEQRGIDVDWFPMNKAESISMPLSTGGYGIAIDPWRLRSTADENVKLAHELGHCETGCFYNSYSSFDVRGKSERRANKWAIKKLIPKDELDKAVRRGSTEVWELAEEFGVTEDFMRMAVNYYKEK